MRKRTLVWLLVAVVAIAAGVLLLPRLLADLVRRKTLQAAEQACGPHSRIHVGAVYLDLLAGDVTWRDIRVEQLVPEGDTAWTDDRGLLISGELDSLHVRGLSIWSLLARRSVAIRTLSVHGPRLQLVQAAVPAGDTLAVLREPPILRLTIDSLRIDSARLFLRHADTTRMQLRTRLDLQLRDLRFEPARGNSPLVIGARDTRADLADIHVALKPLYDLGVRSIHLSAPDSTLSIRGLVLTSLKEPGDYASVVPLETDVFDVQLDSLTLHGLDPARLASDTLLQARVLALHRTRLDVHRDKTLPDGPYRVQPMPPALLRGLPFKLKLDTVLVNDLRVAYFERDQLSPAYGEVVFSDIRSTVTGIDTYTPTDSTTVRLVADAMVYDHAPIKLTITTRVLDPRDRFTVKARIGALPFEVFNRMTDDLALVKATGGRIHRLAYDLDASDDRATGSVALEYEDLAVSIRQQDMADKEKVLLTFVVNTLKRSRNMRGDPGFRTGDVDIARWKDRQIFNYMWRGLKDGIMRTVMPRVVGEVKELTGEKVEQRVQEERGRARKARQREEREKEN